MIKVILPDLVQAAGQNAIEFLCDLLDEALQLSRYGRTGTAREDLSYVWRPAIEDHPQNVGASDLKGLLVSAVRDAIVQLSHNDPSSVSAIVAHLEGREWPIFDRITLHLLRVTAAAPIELISERLTDQDLSERLDTHHEFSLLMRDRFVQLSGEDQPELLARIDAGPDLDAFRKWIAERAGRPSTEDEEEDHVARWQLRRLAIIRDSVPPAWDQRYRELTARFPEPTHPEFVSYSEGVWVGPTSPFSAVQLGSLAAEQVQELLASWQPSGRHRDSSPEGLGRELAAAIAVAPHRFAEAAHRFEGLDPTYVRAIFSGLLEALKQGRAFQWEPVLSLARWVLDQPCELPGRNAHDWDRDPNWGWTRKTIAALLEAGFEQGDAMIPIELRVQVWDTLVPLTSDPDPTPQHEAEYGGSNMDPATLSINTVRGRSMHAVMQYALWVRRHLEQAPDPAERLARGFDEMPEVRSVLEEHLDPQKDPSLAVHAVYGQWLPWLLLLDERWTVQNLPRILPHDQSRRAYNDAAWQAYVTFNPAYTNVFTVLSEEYVRAINAMDALLPSKGRLSDPDDHLARHLMMLYWRGEVDLDDDGVLTRFFQKAPEELRGDALDFMGRMLYSDVGPLDPAGRARLERLWQWRVDAAHCAVPPIGTVSESLAFGWWFAAGKFDDAWALVQLKETLSSIGGVRDDERIDRRGTIHLILERLAGIAPSFPLPAVECLAQVIELDRSGYLYYTWRDHTRTILRAALDSSDEAARRVATDLVHRLGARGYLEFSELLGPAGRGAGQRSSDDADS